MKHTHTMLVCRQATARNPTWIIHRTRGRKVSQERPNATPLAQRAPRHVKSVNVPSR
jgi:hypothetical protein